MPTVPEHIVDFLEGGVSILVGTCDPNGRPDVVRGVGASVSRDRSAVTVFLQEEWGAKALANIRANAELAVGFSRPMDNFAIQLKGKATKLVSSSDSNGDRSVVDRYHASYGEQLHMIGFPRSLVKRFRLWPATAITFDVRDLFLQTPGPGAGRRLDTTKEGSSS